jgi:acylphosphatase
MTKRVHIWISGIVQGVYFRHNTVSKAVEFGVRGWVKNERDGSVEIIGEGTEEQLEQLVAWCRKGPPGSRVEGVVVRWENYRSEFTTFEIEY